MSSLINCTNLTSITIPSSVTDLGLAPFYGCFALESISVAESNSTYLSADGVLFSKDGTELLVYPQGKTDITYAVPASVTAIAPGAFMSSLVSHVTLPSGITSLGGLCFRDCVNLESLTVTGDVPTIGVDAFYNTSDDFEILHPEGQDPLSYLIETPEDRSVSSLQMYISDTRIEIGRAHV